MKLIFYRSSLVTRPRVATVANPKRYQWRWELRDHGNVIADSHCSWHKRAEASDNAARVLGIERNTMRWALYANDNPALSTLERIRGPKITVIIDRKRH